MALITQNIYLHPVLNAESHRTSLYDHVHLEENPMAVLRRGQMFQMSLTFDRDFDEDADNVQIFFNYGPNPLEIKGTQGVVSVKPSVTKTLDVNQNNWFANVSYIGNRSITLEVYAPVTIPVGEWKIQVTSFFKYDLTSTDEYYAEDCVFFVCNPWNSSDVVYMPQEELLGEYVLESLGKIWMGSEKEQHGRIWEFGQFNYYVLKAITLMFERCDLKPQLRGDPIKLCRMITKMVNYDEDNGILFGKWGKSYPGGTRPTAWISSVQILKQYYETGATVKYGQCWVFSGVTTTICRALGIPARSVTNIVSAFDSDLTFTVDRFLDENDIEIHREEEDSFWNFHVWNEVYMARSLLPPGYGGWQAIDATPQRISGDYHQCGPASVTAIKEGQVSYDYDVAFLIASVNSDFVTWKRDPYSGRFKKVSTNKKIIGKYILTKKPLVLDDYGDSDREDITLQYKPKEGTNEERMSLKVAASSNPLARDIYNMPDPEFNEIEFLLEDIERVLVGESFKVVINVTNLISEVRTIKFILTIHSVYYNGVKVSCIAKKPGEIRLSGGESQNFEFFICTEEYLGKLVDFSMMKIHVVGTVMETSQTWSGEDDFEFVKPTIRIRVPDEVLVGQTHWIKMDFINPLNIPLTDCVFTVSGPTMVGYAVIECGNFEPDELVHAKLAVTPTKPGERILIASFISNELTDVTGIAKVYVS